MNFKYKILKATNSEIKKLKERVKSQEQQLLEKDNKNTSKKRFLKIKKIIYLKIKGTQWKII